MTYTGFFHSLMHHISSWLWNKWDLSDPHISALTEGIAAKIRKDRRAAKQTWVPNYSEPFIFLPALHMIGFILYSGPLFYRYASDTAFAFHWDFLQWTLLRNKMTTTEINLKFWNHFLIQVQNPVILEHHFKTVPSVI